MNSKDGSKNEKIASFIAEMNLDKEQTQILTDTVAQISYGLTTFTQSLSKICLDCTLRKLVEVTFCPGLLESKVESLSKINLRLDFLVHDLVFQTHFHHIAEENKARVERLIREIMTLYQIQVDTDASEPDLPLFDLYGERLSVMFTLSVGKILDNLIKIVYNITQGNEYSYQLLDLLIAIVLSTQHAFVHTFDEKLRTGYILIYKPQSYGGEKLFKNNIEIKYQISKKGNTDE